MEFTPINTQEEFDTRVAELYGDVNDLQGKITAHTQTIEQLQGQIKGYETAALKQRIAQEKGIPAEMAARLSGETEKDIRTDAEAMAAMIRTIKGPAPLHDPMEKDPDPKNAKGGKDK